MTTEQTNVATDNVSKSKKQARRDNKAKRADMESANTFSGQTFNPYSMEKSTMLVKPASTSKKDNSNKAVKAEIVKGNVAIAKANQEKNPQTSFVVKTALRTSDHIKAEVHSLEEMIDRLDWNLSEVYEQIRKDIRHYYIVASRVNDDNKRQYALIQVNEKLDIFMQAYPSLADIKAKLRTLNLFKPDASIDSLNTAMQAMNIRQRKASFVEFGQVAPKPVETKTQVRQFVVKRVDGEFLTTKGEFSSDIDLARRFTKIPAYNAAFALREKGIDCKHVNVDPVVIDVKPSKKTDNSQRDNGYIDQTKTPINKQPSTKQKETPTPKENAKQVKERAVKLAARVEIPSVDLVASGETENTVI